MDIINKFYQMDRTKISFLRYIIEAYDNIAVLTTKNRDNGQIVLRIAKGFEDEIEIIISDLKNKLSIKEIDKRDLI